MNFGALTGSLHLLVWEEQIKRFLAYFFQIFSTLSCDTFSNRRCSGHTLLRIARGCLGGRAANKKTVNSCCVKSKVLLSDGFPLKCFRWVKIRKRKVEQRTPTNSTECLALLKSPFWTPLDELNLHLDLITFKRYGKALVDCYLVLLKFHKLLGSWPTCHTQEYPELFVDGVELQKSHPRGWGELSVAFLSDSSGVWTCRDQLLDRRILVISWPQLGCTCLRIDGDISWKTWL